MFATANRFLIWLHPVLQSLLQTLTVPQLSNRNYKEKTVGVGGRTRT